MGEFKIQKNLTYGQFRFLVNGTCECYIDSTGWHDGAAPSSGSAVTTLKIEYDETKSWWLFKIDGTTRAWFNGYG